MFLLHLTPVDARFREESSFDEFQNFGIDAEEDALFTDLDDPALLDPIEDPEE